MTILSIILCILIVLIGISYKHSKEIKMLKQQYKDVKFDLEDERTLRIQQYRNLFYKDLPSHGTGQGTT